MRPVSGGSAQGFKLDGAVNLGNTIAIGFPVPVRRCAVYVRDPFAPRCWRDRVGAPALFEDSAALAAAVSTTGPLVIG
jgi:hypothetical protein